MSVGSARSAPAVVATLRRRPPSELVDPVADRRTGNYRLGDFSERGTRRLGGMPTTSEVPNVDIASAAALLRAGGLVAFPTETVYGLGADATNESAVRRIFEAKGRPQDHPLIVHAASATGAFRWAGDIDPRAYRLAERFWPGPLTLVLQRDPSLPLVVTGGHDTVALRVPQHPVARALLDLAAVPIAAPSANRFGEVSPTRAEHVRESLGDLVDVVLDGGPCNIGLESTIVALTGSEPALLRPGGLEVERIEAVLGHGLKRADSSSPAAPGTLTSHYAPRCTVELVSRALAGERYESLIKQGRRVRLLEPGSSPSADARSLYDSLRSADREGCDVILAVLPQPTGLGCAIGDRLEKAAAPRASAPKAELGTEEDMA